MGNSSSTIGIYTDSEVYTTGCNVTGKVYLSVNNKNGVKATSVNVEVIGEELVEVHHRRNHSCHPFEKNSTKFFNIDFPIATFSSKSQGHYEFPFKFKLPQSLPSSMWYKQKVGQSSCQIKYTIKTRLCRSGFQGFAHRSSFQRFANSISSMAKDSWCDVSASKKVLRVISNSRDPIYRMYDTPIVLPTEHQKINYWCCFNRGQILIGAKLESRLLISGTNVQVAFTCENQSTAEVKEVSVELLETIRFRAHHREEKDINTLHKQIINATTLSELTPLTSLSGYASPRTVIEQTHQVSLHIPHNTRTSFSGNLIHVQHMIKFILKTKCCMTSPDISAIVQVVERVPDSYKMTDETPRQPDPSAPPFDGEPCNPVLNPYDDSADYKAIPLPSNWNPTTSDMATIPIVEATIIEPGLDEKNMY